VSETVRGATMRASCVRCVGLTPQAPPLQIAALSKLVALAPGDLLFMGTPEGVGPVVRGDTIEAAIDGCASQTTVVRQQR